MLLSSWSLGSHAVAQHATATHAPHASCLFGVRSAPAPPPPNHHRPHHHHSHHPQTQPPATIPPPHTHTPPSWLCWSPVSGQPAPTTLTTHNPARPPYPRPPTPPHLHGLAGHQCQVSPACAPADDAPHWLHQSTPGVAGDVLRDVGVVGHHQWNSKQARIQH